MIFLCCLKGSSLHSSVQTRLNQGIKTSLLKTKPLPLKSIVIKIGMSFATWWKNTFFQKSISVWFWSKQSRKNKGMLSPALLLRNGQSTITAPSAHRHWLDASVCVTPDAHALTVTHCTTQHNTALHCTVHYTGTLHLQQERTLC